VLGDQARADRADPLPQLLGFHKRRARMAETIEWLIGVFAAASPGYHDGEAVIGGKGYAGTGFAGGGG
jgi:hypothetical protein